MAPPPPGLSSVATARPFPANALRGKPVAVVGASTGLFGAVWAQAELRKVLAAIGAQALDEELPVGQAHDAFADDGCLADPELRAALTDLANRLLHGTDPGPERVGSAATSA